MRDDQLKLNTCLFKG